MRCFGWVLIGAGIAAAQGPLPTRLLPPDADLVAGVNLTTLRQSRVGQALVANARAHMPPWNKWEGTGFDPLAGAQEILVGSPAGGLKNRGTMLARGGCRNGDIGLKPDAGAAESTVRGVRVLTLAIEGGPMALACIDGSLLVLADPASMRTALARRSDPKAVNSPLAARAQSLRTWNDIWFISRADLSAFAADAPAPQAAFLAKSGVLKGVEQISAGISLSQGLRVTFDLTARTPDEAQRMTAAVMTMTSLMKADSKLPAAMSAVYDALDVQAKGRLVRAALQLTDEQVQDIAGQFVAAARAQMSGAQPQPAAPTSGVTIHSSPKDMGTVKIRPQ